MRISDWSSDVCSSDLILLLVVEGLVIGLITGLVGAGGGFLIIPALVWLTRLPFKTAVGTSLFIIAINSDRKSVVSGKSVSVRVDIGGRRIIKKKITQQLTM